MVNELIRIFFRFLVLIAVQVFVVKFLQLGPFINPFIYILFILLLPFETPPWLGMIVSFLTGLTVDVFYDTQGINAAACTFIGFMRPGVLKLLAPRDGYEFSTQPTMQYQGRAWFMSYAGIMIFTHHLLVFFIEIFRFDEILTTLLKVILSSAATFVLILIIQFLFYRSKETQ